MNLMEKYRARSKRDTVEETPAAPLRVAVKIYSPILEGYLWVVQDRQDWPHLGGGDITVYDAQEIKALQARDLTNDELKAANNIKKVFGAEIID